MTVYAKANFQGNFSNEVCTTSVDGQLLTIRDQIKPHCDLAIFKNRGSKNQIYKFSFLCEYATDFNNSQNRQR